MSIMNGRQHLFIDSIGQAAILIMFAYFISSSEQPLEVAQILPIMLFAWQFFNALVSYKFFEQESKAFYVKVAGWSLLILCIFLGLLWFIANLPMTLQLVDLVVTYAFPVIQLLFPFGLGILAIWYLSLSFKEVYHQLFNRI